MVSFKTKLIRVIPSFINASKGMGEVKGEGLFPVALNKAL